MPFYTCFATAGSLSATQKTFVAEEITRIHTTLTDAPRSFVRVFFQDMQPSFIFSGGKNQPFAMIRGVIPIRGNQNGIAEAAFGLAAGRDCVDAAPTPCQRPGQSGRQRDGERRTAPR